jgi:alpha-beta hydrolase superfamily lysophospholipase
MATLHRGATVALCKCGASYQYVTQHQRTVCLEHRRNQPVKRRSKAAQPTQTLAEIVRADERLKKEFAQITLPVSIIHGTADGATRPSGSQHCYDRAGARDKALKLYEGYHHDALNNLGRETVMADIVSWIDARVAAPPQRS